MTLQNWLAHYPELAPSTTAPSTEWVEYAGRDELVQFLQAVTNQPPAIAAQQRALHAALARLVRRATTAQMAPETQVVDGVVGAYRAAVEFPDRYLFLQFLAAMGGEYALQQLANVLAESPPDDTSQVAMLLSPLLQPRARHELPLLFPRILDAVGHVSTAAAVLDLANYATRNRLVDDHPACSRAARLASMLGDLAHRLEKIDESHVADPEMREQQRQMIDEGVPLAVALCDTLALIGDPQYSGMLNRALDLRHRRIRAEAAAALARLGDPHGQEELVKLAAEPSARLRVLAYADELGILEQIDPQYRTDEARAASSLALWLAEPSQLGLPPTSLSLIDQRQLYWPGYEEPVDCYLFQFEYELGGGKYSNVGIAGPLTHAFAASLEDLPPDDIYAAFAGWHAEHSEIQDHAITPADQQSTVVQHLVEKLEASGFSNIKPLTIGSFFGDQVLVANAAKSDREGIVVVDEESVDFRPSDLARRPIGEFEAYCIYKGRRLLDAFN